MHSQRYFGKYAPWHKPDIIDGVRASCLKDITTLLEKIEKTKHRNGTLRDLLLRSKTSKIGERQKCNQSIDTADDEMRAVQCAKVPPVTEGLNALGFMRLRIHGSQSQSKKRPTTQDANRHLRDKFARQGSPTY